MPVSDAPAAVEIIPLLTDLRRRYDITEEHIDLGSRSLAVVKIRDTNRLLETIDAATFATDERLPYWADLWPSSIELARFCLDEISMRGRTVLELGCGLGFAGIAAASAGARVIFTDYEHDALNFARLNAWANLPLDVWSSQVRFRHMDWRSPGRIDRVDSIIGADVTYERHQFLPLLRLVQKSLKAGCSAVFVDPDRSMGMSFFALAEREGFHVSLQSRLATFRGREGVILLGELRRV